MSTDDREQFREMMREKYAVHHTEVRQREEPTADEEPGSPDDEADTGEPMRWD